MVVRLESLDRESKVESWDPSCLGWPDALVGHAAQAAKLPSSRQPALTLVSAESRPHVLSCPSPVRQLQAASHFVRKRTKYFMSWSTPRLGHGTIITTINELLVLRDSDAVDAEPASSVPFRGSRRVAKLRSRRAFPSATRYA